MPPQKISHYELLEPLGRGGMGVVHKARDVRLDRFAALKFLSPDLLGSPEARARFLREARSLSALSHPHIATVYEVDESDGTPFLAMEYLPGGTLRLRVEAARTSGIPVEEAKILNWGIGLAEGLAHAHSKGIVHRDVKSSNAMFDEEGRIKLTDFGLAKGQDGGDLTTSGHIVGTVAYMSPEQLSGGVVDHRSDLYSLGVVLYELATGQLPFSGNSPGEVVKKIVSAEVPKVSLVRPEIPPALDGVVTRLLSKDVDDRYQRAQDALHDLLRIRSATGDPSLLSTQTLKFRAAARRFGRPAMVGAAVIAVAALAIGFWPTPKVLPANKNILVLPIRSIGGDANQEVLCDGLTETLTTALTQTGLLSVVAGVDARKVKTVQQARRDYGVNLVLDASLQRRGDSVRLTLSLIDADKNRQLGAESVNGAAARPFQIEEAMLAKVADLVDVAVPRTDVALRATSPAATSGAFDAYLKGRGFLYRYDKPGNLERAQKQFEEAIRVDPQFALAHAGLADARLRVYRQRREKTILDGARTAAERALALNPALATAHATYGAVLADSGQPDAAIVQLEKAIEVDPREPAAYRELAAVYAAAKKQERAEETYQKAIRARPGDWRSYSNLATYYYNQQRYADAERLFRRVIELTPDNHLGYRNLGGLMVVLGRNEEAEALLLKAESLNPTAKAGSNLGSLYMVMGRYRDAVAILERAVVLAARDVPNDYKIWGNLGDAYWLDGAPDDKKNPAYRHAVEIAERLRAGSTDNADLSSGLAEYYAKLGERDLAVERIESALTTDPKSATVHYQAGLVYAIVHDDARARRELDEALGLGIAPDQIQQAPELKALRESGALANVQK